jgi:hypothetical protein
MSRLLRAIITFLLCVTCLSGAGVAWAYQHSGRQSLKHGELEPAVSQLDNSIWVNARKLDRVGEWIVVTPEPVSLALFGSGLTMAGVFLLRCSRRTKWSTNTRDAHWAVDKSCVRPARNANKVQYPRPDFPARDQFVATCMPSGSK